MICFSLKEPVSYEKIVREIDQMIKKQIKSQEQAESTILVIKLTEVSHVVETVETVETKNLTQK